MVDSRSNDLFWGDKLRENTLLITSNQFNHRLQSQSVVIVVMDRQFIDFKATAYFDQFKGEKRIGQTTVFFN